MSGLQPESSDGEKRVLSQRRLNTQLLQAVCNKKKDRVISLLDSGANPKTRCRQSLMSVCHLAVYHGENDILEALLSAGADPTARDRRGIQPHHLAAFHYLFDPSLSCLNTILAKDGSLVDSPIEEPGNCGHYQVPEDELDSFVHDHEQVSKLVPENVTEGSTMLFIATIFSLKELVEELIINRHADVNKTTKDNLKALDVVGLEEGIEIKELSQRNVADTSSTGSIPDSIITLLLQNDGRPSQNTLGMTVMSGDVQAVTECLKSVTPDSRYENERTLLHLAVKNDKKTKENEKKYYEILEKLLEKDLNAINLQDSEGKTPLFSAVEGKWMADVELLLVKGADITIPSYCGENLFHLVAKQGNRELLEELVKLAETQGIDPDKLINKRDNDGYTPLIRAVEFLQYSCTDVLLEFVCWEHLETCGGRNLSILHSAVNATPDDDIKIIEMIVEFLLPNDINDNADIVNGMNDEGLTAVELAASLGKRKCLEFLLSYKEISKHFLISIAETKGKRTALHLASKSGHYETVEYLSDNYPLLISKFDRKRRSALILAALGGHEKCVYALLRAGANLADRDLILKRSAIDIIMNYIPNPVQMIGDLLNSFTGEKQLEDEQNKNFIKYRQRNDAVTQTSISGITWNANEYDPDSCKVLLETSTRDDCWNQPDSLNFEVLLDYKFLVAGARELEVIEAVSDCDFEQLQQTFFLHPLVKSFLILKWKRVDTIFTILSYLYIFHVCSVTGLALLFRDQQFSAMAWCCRAGIWVTIIPIIFVEVLNGILDGRVFSEAEIHTKWLSICTAGMLSVVPELKLGTYLASLTVLLSWMELLLFYAMNPKWGLYILMFFEVVKNVFQVLSTFLFLIVGFTLSFYILFNGHHPFPDLWSSLCEVLAMMLELGYNDIFNEEYANTKPFKVFGRIMYLGFLFLVIMVLSNIILGMSVGDVTQLEGKSKLLAKQGSFLSLVDKFSYSEEVLLWFPRWFRNHLKNHFHSKLKQLTVYPNRHTSKSNPLEKDILYEIMTVISGRKFHSEDINSLATAVKRTSYKVDEIYQQVKEIHRIVEKEH